MTPLEVALEWATRGVPAFPVTLTAKPNGKVTKTPATRHGHHDATTDLEALREMFAQSRANGVGLHPGPAGLVVVDIDTKGACDGFETAGELDLPDTFTVTTPSGGEHRWFRKPAGTTVGNLSAPGIDIRSDAGWVVAPGTSSPWGSWATVSEWSEVVELPERCLRRIAGGEPTAPASTSSVDLDEFLGGEPSREIEAVVGRWMLRADEGRHPAAMTAVATLVRLGERRHPGASEALEAIRLDFIERVTRDGSRTARHAEREWSDMVRDAAKVVASTPATAPLHVPEKTVETARDGLKARMVRGLEIARLPRPQWLVEGVLARPSLAILIGPPKQGKTFAALDLAASVVSSRTWMDRPTSGSSVVYVVGEGVGGVGARLEAWSAYCGVVEALGHIHWHLGPVQLTSTSSVDALADYCREVDADLVVLDTLARCAVGVEENSAREMGVVVEHGLQRLRDASGATVLAIHHTGKDTSQGARGSSALLGAVDTEIVCDKRGEAIRLTVRRQKDGIEGHSVTGHLEPVGDSAVFVPGAGGGGGKPPNVDHLLDTLKEIAGPEGLSTTAWMEATELPATTFYRARKWLTERFVVRNIGTDGRPRYVPNSSEGGGSNEP